MPRKSDVLRKGAVLETVFWRNEGQQNDRYPLRANTVGRLKAPKVILSADRRIPKGKPVRVKVVRVSRAKSPGRGFIEVEYMGPVKLALDPDIYVDESVVKKLQVLLEAGYSILLDGPQGSGKTTLARSIAEALEMEYVYFNCSSVIEATDFMATLQLRAADSGAPETVFIETEIAATIRRAAEEESVRFLVFLDEFNRCRPMARNGLMPALDATRKIYDPATNSFLSIPENVQFCAAINNGTQFVGTTTVDPAQMDRFATLKLDYPPPREERRILAGRFPTLKPKLLDQVVQAANVIRGSDELQVDLSMRATEEACVFLSHPSFTEGRGWRNAFLDALATAFCARLEGRIDDPLSDAGRAWELLEEAFGS